MNYFINVLIIAILIITTFYNKCFVNKLRQKTCSAQHVFNGRCGEDYSRELPLGGSIYRMVDGMDTYQSLFIKTMLRSKKHALLSMFLMVGVERLELPPSWSRTMRATNCATPRKIFTKKWCR